MDINDAFNGFCIISNGFIVFRESRYEDVQSSKLVAKGVIRSQIKALSKKNVSKHKNPEDALGAFMAEIDFDQLGRDIDFSDLDRYIGFIIKTKERGLVELFTEQNVLDVCDTFDTNVCDLTKLLLEKYPDKVDIIFLKKVIKPFVIKLQREKSGYEQRLSGYYYKPIFEYI